MEAFLNQFIPKEFESDLLKLKRAKLLVFISFYMPLPAPFLFFLFYRVTGSLQFAVTTVVTALIAMSCPFILRKTKSLALAGNLYVFILHLNLTSISYFSNGIHSAAVYHMALVPMVVLYVAGKRHGLYWATIVVVQLLVYYFLERRGIIFPKYTSMEGLAQLNLTGAVVLVFHAAALFLYADSVTLQLMRIIQDQQKANAQTEKMASLGVMASGIAHEINTPLGVILLLLSQLRDLASKGKADQAQTGKMLDTMQASGTKIARITNGLRAFAQAEKFEPYTETDFPHILEHALLLCQNRFSETATELSVEGDRSNIRLRCRPIQITQVLINLFNNAIDAVEGQPTRQVKLAIAHKGQMIELRISDSGPGIAPEVRDKIFDPFFTTKPIGKGTGLGLSVSKGLIDAHKGIIFLDERALNTTFVIQLPTNC